MSASDLDARYGRIVRTPELPMAFTFGEFARGAGIAWAAFQVLFPIGYGLVTAIAAIVASAGGADIDSGLGMVLPWMFFVGLYALPWSIGALILLGAPLAYVLGWALRRVPRRAVHVIAFAALGTAVGVVVCSTGTGSTFGPGAAGFVWLAAPVTALSVAFGWWRTATRALRDDAQDPQDAQKTPAQAATPPAESDAPRHP